MESAEALRIASQQIGALQLAAAPFELRFVSAQAESTGSVCVRLQGLEPLPEQLPAGSWVVLVGRTSAAEAMTLPRLLVEQVRAATAGLESLLTRLAPLPAEA